MDEDKLRSEVLLRKFQPISDWKPASEEVDIAQTLKSIFNETLEQAQKRRDALEQSLGPVTDEAWTKIKEMAGFLEDTTLKSSQEARSFLAKTLQAMAEKIKP